MRRIVTWTSLRGEVTCPKTHAEYKTLNVYKDTFECSMWANPHVVKTKKIKEIIFTKHGDKYLAPMNFSLIQELEDLVEIPTTEFVFRSGGNYIAYLK